MAKEKTIARGIRISESDIPLIQARARRRKFTFNQWVNWAIADALRPRRRKG